MVYSIGESGTKKCSFVTALDMTGFGKYNITMLAACCFFILAMYMDIFSFSVVMPAVACDMELSTTQQGILSAVPLIGVIISSYGWGLAADIIGRRKALLIAMPVGFVLGLATSMAPSYTMLAVLKFFSVMFTSAANAAAFVLMAESVPSKHRSRFMFFLAGTTMVVLCLMCSCAIPIFKLAFHREISWLHMEYRPWRLLLQIVTLPGAAAVLILLFLSESPKFLLSKDRHEEAVIILRGIFQSNTGCKKDAYSVTHIFLEEPTLATTSGTSVLRKIWNQTAPLFKPPLLRNSSILYYLMLCAYMTSTGYTIWVPTMTNAFFTGEETSGFTFCQVASRSVAANITNPVDCDHIIQLNTLYAVMSYSGVSALLTILLSFLVGPLGKKITTLLVFAISTLCGVLLIFVKIPLLSIALFYMFLYVAQILGNMNTYLVELNPTHLRGMATCLSVVVARGSGFFSVQLIGSSLENYCTPMLIGYIILVFSGLIVAGFLPPDIQPTMKINEENNSNVIEQYPENNKN